MYEPHHQVLQCFVIQKHSWQELLYDPLLGCTKALLEFADTKFALQPNRELHVGHNIPHQERVSCGTVHSFLCAFVRELTSRASIYFWKNSLCLSMHKFSWAASSGEVQSFCARLAFVRALSRQKLVSATYEVKRKTSILEISDTAFALTSFDSVIPSHG